MTSFAPSLSDRAWRHGGPWSTLPLLLVVAGAVLTVFVDGPLGTVGLVLAVVGLVLGVYVTTRPVNRRR